jgi:6-phospho-beta-glucosidase
MKISVIGGASSYTPELFANLIELHGKLDVEQVTLMDPNPAKLDFVTRVCERLVDASEIKTRVTATQDREQAIAGADFILLQVRVGGLEARVRDERLPMELGLVGNETTGAGGFVCALRTVPVALEIAREIERIAPDAWLLNLSNPAGIVTEALLKHSQVRTIGFCNIPINTTFGLAKVLGVSPSEIYLDSFGLNHLSWVRGAYVNGEEKLQPLLAETHNRSSALYQNGVVDSLIDPDWLHNLGMIPGWYLRYFYYTAEVFDEEQHSQRSKGEKDMVAEERLREVFSTAGYNQEAREILESKGGARYYMPVLQVIRAILEDSGDVIVVDVRNGHTLPDLPPEVCVEVPARIGKSGVEPLPFGPMPLNVRGLVQVVKTYEELTVESAIQGDQDAAIEALVINPLVGTYPKARTFFDRMLENERSYLHQFYRR